MSDKITKKFKKYIKEYEKIRLESVKIQRKYDDAVATAKESVSKKLSEALKEDTPKNFVSQLSSWLISLITINAITIRFLNNFEKPMVAMLFLSNILSRQAPILTPLSMFF